MGIFNYKGKDYEIDSLNFLKDYKDWDENFAEGMSLQLKISQGLTIEHWDIIKYIRNSFLEKGVCPNVYETARVFELRIAEMRKLFPTGYWRGACKIAGMFSGGAHFGPAFDPSYLPETLPFMDSYNKTYEIDVRGFLVNPEEWDEYYAIYRAYEMKIHGGKLNDRHWQIIRFLRERYAKTKEVPTIYETCEANQIDLEELERLFPDGYHRSVVKLSGLRLAGPPSKRF
jgi:tRNA 2-thiouridine synthesizing protein E